MTSPSESGEESPVEPRGALIPVFCTADIPSQTLNLLLEMDAEHRNKASYRLWLVTDYSDKVLDAIDDKHSRPPVQSFSSPCIGMKYRQINEIFWQKFAHQRGFCGCVFLVLDSATAEDESLTVVEARDPAEWTKDDNEIDTLRTDFYAARQVAMLTDVNFGGLLENRDWTRVYEGREFEMDL